ncbi:MAG: potassium channel protein [Deltaproteobacteria bacterium]|nr:MAG: potassium channel protein [Deltaproteobacteria bacterium]
MAESPPSSHTGSRAVRARQALDRFLVHPVTELVLIVLILTAVLSVLAEEATRGQPISDVFAVISDTMAVIFAVELTLRFLVIQRKRSFFIRYWADILAILPVYRGLRLFRVLMLLRLFRAGVLLNRRMRFLGGVIKRSLSEITIVATISATLVLVGAVLVHTGTGHVVIEQQGVDADSLQGALWFSVYTLVAGEPTGGMPASPIGRLVTLGLMLGGLTVFGVFVGTVSATMTNLLTQRLELDIMHTADLNEHIVVCGWNPAGATMLRELVGPASRHALIVVVGDHDEEPVELAELRARHEQIRFHRADYTRVDVLEDLAIGRAAAVIILTDMWGDRTDADRDARTVLTALTIERLSPGIFVCAELINSQHEDLLRMAGVEAVVIRDWYAGVVMGSIGRSRGMAAVLSDLLTTTTGNAFHKVEIPRRLHGRTVMELHLALKNEHNAILVSIEPRQGGALVNPPADHTVAAGDQAVVIAPRPFRL